MRLVIVPVTQKLISGNSRAMDVEIPFAIKKNIPILPIMVEENKSRELVEAFRGDESLIETADSDEVPGQTGLVSQVCYLKRRKHTKGIKRVFFKDLHQLP